MRSIVAEAFNEARAKSTYYGRVASGDGAATSMVGGGNPLGLGASSAGVNVGRHNTLAQHQEQLRHYTGWVHASIGPIAKRVARQPLRIARVPRAGNDNKYAQAGPAGPSGTKTTVTRLKPWEHPHDPKEIAKRVWFKRALPGSLKTYHETAELIETHPLLDAINDPNPIMVRWSLLFVTVACLMLTGKAYWWVKAREDDSDPSRPKVEIWPVPPNWIEPVHTPDRLYDHWKIRPEGQAEPTPVPPEQIVYFFFPDPANPLGAYAPLQAQSRAVVCDESIAEAQRRGFTNGLYPGLAVIVGRQTDINGQPGDRPALTKEQRQQILTAFRQAYRGPYNHDEPIILDKIIEDVKRVTNTVRDMDFMASGAYTKERITQGFGTNPIVMGQVEGANRASSATADDHLCQSTVNPIIELMSECLTAWFNPLFATSNERILVFLEEAHAVDPDSDRADWALLAAQGAAQRNELRAALKGLPPIRDGEQALIPAGMGMIDCTREEDVPKGSGEPLALPSGDPDGDDATETPAQSSEPGATGDAEQVQDTALNGAQVKALLLILDSLRTGQIPADAARAMIQGVFPGIRPDLVDTMVNAIAAMPRQPAPVDDADGAIRAPRARDFGGDHLDEIDHTVPDIRQEYPYDCGAAAARSAAEFAGIECGTEEEFMILLDTTPELGTTPDDLYALFAHAGCSPRRREHLSIGHLRNELQAGRIVICAVQYFGDGPVPGGEGGAVASGHWIVVKGFTRDTIRYQDPIDGPGELSNQEFLDNWYDREQDGTALTRFGISIGRAPEPMIDPTLYERGGEYVCKAHKLAISDRVEQWEKAHAEGEQTLKKAVREFLRSERRRIVAQLDAALARHAKSWTQAKPITTAKSDDTEPDGDEDRDFALDALLNELVPVERMTRRLRSAVGEPLATIAETGAAIEHDDLAPSERGTIDEWIKARRKPKKKPPVDRKPLPKAIRQRVNDYIDDMIDDPYWADINKTTRRRMGRAVRRGLAHQEDAEQIADRIRKALPESLDDMRAEMIARTEATGALNIGYQAAREHFGPKIVKGKVWASREDLDVRDTHQKAHGQFRKTGSRFRVGGFWCEYPGDPSLPPKERCNCRCVGLTIPAD